MQHRRVTQTLRNRKEPTRPRVIQRSGGKEDVIGPPAVHLEHLQHLPGIADTIPYRTFRLAGGAGCIDHRTGWIGRIGFHIYRSMLRGCNESSRVELIVARCTVEYNDVAYVRDFGANLFEQCRVLGIGEDEFRVGVVDDVGRFLGGKSIVQRYRDGADLARRMAAGHDPHRVVSAPDDLVFGLDAVIQKNAGQPIRVGLELGEAPLDERAVGAIVNQRRFSAELLGERRE